MNTQIEIHGGRVETMNDQLWPFSAEEKLQFLPQILNSVSQPVIAIDRSGRVLYMNRCASDVYGWEATEGNHADINKLIITPSIMGLVQENLDMLGRGDTVKGDIQTRGKEGEEIPARFKAKLIKGDNSEVISLTLELQDRINMQRLETANRILTEVDKLLGNMVDYDAMLKNIVDFIVPELADWCGIYVKHDNRSIERMALAPSDIVNHQSIYEWLQNDLTNDENDGLPYVLNKAEPVLMQEVSATRRAASVGIKSYMILPLITHQKVRGAIALISTKPGRMFNQQTLQLAKNLAINISIYLEKNRIYKESQNLRDELEKRVIERTAELSDAVSQLKKSEELLQTLFRISNKLNSTLDVETILDELALEAIRLVNGESGFAGLRTSEGMHMRKYFHNGVARPYEFTWKLGDGIPGWVLKYKVPYGTSDAVNDPNMRHDLPLNDGVRNVICTPILDSVGEVIAYFDIRNKQGGDLFDTSDQEMLLTLAPVASIAIQNALAYQQRLASVAEFRESSRRLEELAAKLDAAREEERLHISRELHDQLGQALTVMKFDLTKLVNGLVKVDDDLANKTKDIMTQVNTMIKAVRRIATELRPGMLEDLGLLASIEWQADDFQKRTGIECKVFGPRNGIDLNRDQSLVLFRIFQEALTNVARYAEAKHVDIELSNTEQELSLEIHDDGRGIRAEEITGSQSLGLLGMQERVKHIGGTFEITGEENRGTTIRVCIPKVTQ